MFIRSIELKNFKCFKENKISFCLPDGNNEGSGLNILIGENNSGKSSAIESIHFLRNKIKDEPKNRASTEKNDFYVDLKFTGKIEEAIENFVQENKRGIFKNRIYTENGEKIFRVRRNFNDAEEIKKLLIYNNETKEYKNETGIDGPFQALFQISNIWADTNPEKESKFGSTTICGNLLSEILEKFEDDHKGQYQNFLNIFNKIFNNNEGGLQKDLNLIAKKTEEVLSEQFGKAELKFKFENPEPSIIFNNFKILVDDGEETELSEKGHGMQRAVILSLLQVYAHRMTELRDENGSVKIKPHFLFIDEPEIGLHPQAQKKLFEALKIIAKDHQIFISTHSENFISPDLVKNIYRFKKNSTHTEISSGNGLTIDLGPNRKFFYHHHKLLFANRAIFVEGADDYDFLPMFLKKIGKKDLFKDFYFLAGSGDALMFKDFCEHFNINSFFIFDLDVIHKNSTLFNRYPQIKEKIKKFDKDLIRGNDVEKKDRSKNLFDISLNDDEKMLKYEILTDLKKGN